MLSFQLQILLHHGGVRVEIVSSGHGVMMSISLKIVLFRRR